MENTIFIIIGLAAIFAALIIIRLADTTVRMPFVYGILSHKKNRRRHVLKFINEKMNEAIQLGYTLMMAGDDSLRKYGIYERDIFGVRMFYPHEKFTVTHHPSLIFQDSGPIPSIAKFVGYVDNVDWNEIYQKYRVKISVSMVDFFEQMVNSYSALKESGYIINDNMDTLVLVETFGNDNNPVYALRMADEIIGQVAMTLSHHVGTGSADETK